MSPPHLMSSPQKISNLKKGKPFVPKNQQSNTIYKQNYEQKFTKSFWRLSTDQQIKGVKDFIGAAFAYEIDSLQLKDTLLNLVFDLFNVKLLID